MPDLTAIIDDLGGLFLSKRDHAAAHDRAVAFVNDEVAPLIAEARREGAAEAWEAGATAGAHGAILQGAAFPKLTNPHRSAVSGEPNA